jgi:hypothetical protein
LEIHTKNHGIFFAEKVILALPPKAALAIKFNVPLPHEK